MPAPFEANVDVTKTLIAIAATALFAAAGLVFAWIKRGPAADAGWSGSALAPVIIGAAVFFVMATLSFKQFKTLQQGKQGAVLRIDENGITDVRLGAKTIPWSAVRGVEIKDLSNAKMTKHGDDDARERPQRMGVVVQVENASAYIDADGLLAETAKAVGAATNFDQLTLSHSGLDKTAEDIHAAVQAHLR